MTDGVAMHIAMFTYSPRRRELRGFALSNSRLSLFHLWGFSFVHYLFGCGAFLFFLCFSSPRDGVLNEALPGTPPIVAYLICGGRAESGLEY